MIIQNCQNLLRELSEIEEKIQKIENCLNHYGIQCDRPKYEELLKKAIALKYCSVKKEAS